MNKNAKNIDSSFAAEISRIKGYILMNQGAGFDGDGHAFRQALKEVRQAGVKIRYDRSRGLYFKEDREKS